jgi:hypothetical protein
MRSRARRDAGRAFWKGAAQSAFWFVLMVSFMCATSCAQSKTAGAKGDAARGGTNDAQNQKGAQPARNRPLPDRQADTKEASRTNDGPPGPVVPLVADPDTPNISGPDHALLDAVRRTDAQAVKALLKIKGINLNVRENGMTPLLESVSLKAQGESGVEILKLLLENGADVKAKNRQNETALYLAALRADPEMVRLLLAHKADPNVAVHDPSKGETAMRLVRSKLREQPKDARLVEIEKLLKTAGAK